MPLDRGDGSIGATGTMRTSPALSHSFDLLDRARPSWHGRAACRSGDVDFFDEKAEAIAAARAVCRSCPVAPQCRHYGSDEKFGVWGESPPSSAARAGAGRAEAGSGVASPCG